ncbi:MAG: WD40/YVTN/BNR-like repeat-containing protein, partial [Pyrinomonadaceae bacterium]
VLTETVKVLTPTEDGKNGMFAGTDKGLYRSYDLTKGWEKISFGTNIDENIFVVFATSKQPETIWVGTAGSGVIVSRDSGATWQKVTGVPEDVPVSSIVVDPNRPDYVYVGTSQMIYLSRDGGKTWRRGGNLPLGNFTSILINPHNSNEVFASSALESDGGIFFSKDEGANWKRMDSKEMKLPSRRIWSMAFDPNDSNRIFAGTHSSGVYRIERAPSTASNQTLVRPRIITAGN